MSTSEQILIGRNAEGEKLYVQARLEYSTSELWQQRTDHAPTTERLRLSIQGTLISKYGNLENDRSWLAGGQLINDLGALVSLADGWTVADVVALREIWSEWHLNDMNAACDHQESGKNRDDDPAPCPVTGYVYGSAWLFKSIPYSVFKWICERFEIEPPEPGSAPTTGTEIHAVTESM